MIKTLLKNIAWIPLGIGVLITPLIIILVILFLQHNDINYISIDNNSSKNFQKIIISDGKKEVWTGTVQARSSIDYSFESYTDGSIIITGELEGNDYQCFGPYITPNMATHTRIIISPKKNIEVHIYFNEDNFIINKCEHMTTD